MSTNKNKKDLTKVTAPSNNKTTTKKTNNKAAAAVAPSPAKTPNPAPAAKPTEYPVGTVTGVRFEWDTERDRPYREVKVVHVSSDRDLANEPAEGDALIEQAQQDLIDSGYYLNDDVSCQAALMQIESVMDQLAHDVEYGGCCKKCIAANIHRGVKYIKAVREFKDTVDDVVDALFMSLDDPKKGISLPDVLPNDLKNYKAVNGRLVRKGPEVKVDVVRFEDLPKEVKEVAAKAIANIAKSDKK